ncbi:3-oxoacyl-[acyl-carrier protein] reductase [Rhodoligotrophos appendicifer]|uniref:SDR family NAD(P)-dependent oxidoreductase n=1 Tax=Rhodoligotrophos appendicifer TaxID=987056 RepID=UPI001478CCF6|nr:SDR family oxidoreductase [Rhodoligotrophos appendicifer]
MGGDFEGQYGIVTGAGRGLGAATARMMAERGATVLLVDIDADSVEATASGLRSEGLRTHAIAMDLADESQYPALHEAISSRFGGRLDVLVNNAGGWRYSTAREITIDEWEWMFRTNVTSMFLATRAVMDIMVGQRSGRIVNVASGAAHRPRAIMPHYGAAKASVVSLTKSFAEELAPSQILVNAVSPGPIATETLRARGNLIEERAKSIPLGRVAEPEDLAEVILFLASTRNRYIVGQTIIANGVCS